MAILKPLPERTRRSLSEAAKDTITVYEDELASSSQRYRWTRRTRNGRVRNDSSEGYSSRALAYANALASFVVCQIKGGPGEPTRKRSKK